MNIRKSSGTKFEPASTDDLRNWFLYDIGLSHERVKRSGTVSCINDFHLASSQFKRICGP